MSKSSETPAAAAKNNKKPVIPIVAAGIIVIFGGLLWFSQQSVKEAVSLKGKINADEQGKKDLEKTVNDLKSNLTAKEQEAAEARQKADDLAKQAEAARLASLDVPASWATAEVKPIGLTFRYPDEWGAVNLKTFTLDPKTGERGEGGVISFANLRSTKVQGGWNSADFNSQKSVLTYDVVRAKGIQNCDDLKNRYNISYCETGKDMDGNTVLVFKENPPAEDAAGAVTFTFNGGVLLTGDQHFPTFGFQVNQDADVSFEALKKLIYSAKKIASPQSATSTPGAASGTPAAASGALLIPPRP